MKCHTVIRAGLLSIFPLVLLFSRSVAAETHFLLEAGVGASRYSEEGTGFETTVEVGLGIVLSPYFSMGVEGSVFEGEGNSQVEFTVIPFSFNLKYYSMSVSDGPYFGINFGAANRSSNLVDTSSETAFALGAQMGYRFEVIDSFGVGPKFNYYYVLADRSYSWGSLTINFSYEF
ncbi:porin family protein [bacterium]|nr:porin family protein [bacterium]